VTASGQPVGTMPLGQWVNVAIEIELGAEAPRTYRLTLAVPGREPVVRELPYRSDDFRRIDWLGISSTSQTATVFYIDNLSSAPRRNWPSRRDAAGSPLCGTKPGENPAEPPNDQHARGALDLCRGRWLHRQRPLGLRQRRGDCGRGSPPATFGTAMLCDARGTHVTVEDHESLRFGTGDFSIDLWICPTMLAIGQGDARRRFLSKSDHPRTWWVMDITPAGRISLEMADSTGSAGQPHAGRDPGKRLEPCGRGGGPGQPPGPLLSRTANWTAPTNCRPASPVPLDVPADLTIGSTWQPFIGLLDEVRIFKRTLDEAEIKAAYEREKGRRDSVEYRVIE
jgi:hypothetical protein